MTTDLALVRRLESAEGAANAAFVDARAAVTPSSGALWRQIGGAYAMFDGPDSPLTQTFGLGLDGAVPEGDFLALERFFLSRGAPVCHEVSPYITADTLRALSDRGYRPIELSTVLVRSTMVEPVPVASAVRVRRVEDSERDVWARVAGQGWASESAELATFVEAFGRITSRAAGVHCFVAEMDGRPIATATLCLQRDVALLAGASTLESARRQGAQQALSEARLRFAAARGITLAMVVTQPGSGSQRNAERQGFRPVYTRTKWRLAAPTPS